MTTISMTTASEPDGAPRIANLDILRGIAILGILFMNINDMGGSLWASFDDVRHLGWTTSDQVAWWLREVFANGTARCLLEMLFGVGMVILTDRVASTLGASAESSAFYSVAARTLFGPREVLRGYYLRNFILFLFGLVHLFILMWPGDILHTYGIAAMVAFLFRRLGPKALLAVGSILAVMQLLGIGIALHNSQQNRIDVPRLEAKRAAGVKLTADEAKRVTAFEKRKVERVKSQAETARRVAREDARRSADTGSFTTWVTSAWATALFIFGMGDGIGDGQFLEPLFIWEAASTMLIGAALFKWGVIQGQRSRGFYVRMTLVGYLIGLGGRAIAAYWTAQFDDYPHLIAATGEVTRLATTLGHIGLVTVLLQTASGATLLRPFAAAGRTALTIYIAQTMICLWVLYPPFMLGLYGQQGWMALMLTALAVNALLLWGATIWVKHYDIAPVEWAWRSIVERRVLPWRRPRKSGDNPVPAGIAPA